MLIYYFNLLFDYFLKRMKWFGCSTSAERRKMLIKVIVNSWCRVKTKHTSCILTVVRFTAASNKLNVYILYVLNTSSSQTRSQIAFLLFYVNSIMKYKPCLYKFSRSFLVLFQSFRQSRPHWKNIVNMIISLLNNKKTLKNIGPRIWCTKNLSVIK